MSVRDEVVNGARRWLGTMYDWGGEGLRGEGVDCSGLIIAAYRAAGRPLSGRPVASQIGRMGTAVSSLADALPGDVIYFDNPGSVDHVGIYVGNGRMIDSPTTGQKVSERAVGKFTSIRRILTGDDAGGARGGGGTFGTTPDAGGGGFELPGWLDAVAEAISPGYAITQAAGGTGGGILGGVFAKVGGWLASGLLILVGAVLLILALVLVAKGGESATTKMVLPAEGEGGGGKAAGRSRGAAAGEAESAAVVA